MPIFPDVEFCPAGVGLGEGVGEGIGAGVEGAVIGVGIEGGEILAVFGFNFARVPASTLPVNVRLLSF